MWASFKMEEGKDAGKENLLEEKCFSWDLMVDLHADLGTVDSSKGNDLWKCLL